MAAGRSGLCSTLQLKPVPGSPTVVRGPPLQLTGILKEAPRPPTKIELKPTLEKLKQPGLSPDEATITAVMEEAGRDPCIFSAQVIP